MGAKVSSIVAEGKGKPMQRTKFNALPIVAEDLSCTDTSNVQPEEDELSDSEWIEVDEPEPMDQSLTEDGRPGRRTMAYEK
ncbi:hypothetical protein NX059_009084 [Plenodomus lindquistii]|nr:hypothetical protein NX059_009084 [Plenodomus lindquistii]